MHYHKKNYFKGGGKWKCQNQGPYNRLSFKLKVLILIEKDFYALYFEKSHSHAYTKVNKSWIWFQFQAKVAILIHMQR